MALLLAVERAEVDDLTNPKKSGSTLWLFLVFQPRSTSEECESVYLVDLLGFIIHLTT